jgi:hypothetical protein
MVTWIWRLLLDENNDLLWVRLLRAKYRVAELFTTTPATWSPFWHILHKIKQAFKLVAKFHPGKNFFVSFWKDVSLGDSSLAQSSQISLRNVQTQTCP